MFALFPRLHGGVDEETTTLLTTNVLMEDWYLLAAPAVFVAVFAYQLASGRRARRMRTSQAPSVATVIDTAERQRHSSEVDASIALEKENTRFKAELPKLAFEEDEDVEPTLIGQRDQGWLSPPTAKIVYDEDAAIDEPTRAQALIMVSAVARTDKGVRRRRNEDSVLVREDEGLFVVADGMGGYRGGELASKLAVSTIEKAFEQHRFVGPPHESIPSRASELARAIQMANTAILRKASEDKRLSGMGTTVCAARFSPNKQRLYIGHVGDSRIYCLRDGTLRQMTSDHTMKDLGIQGEAATHLSRAVGVWPTVPIDIILGKPRPGDVYLLCSDGLTKMVSDEKIQSVLQECRPHAAVEQLIGAANDHGGNDNITIVVVRIDDPPSATTPERAA
jgi:PPM family protein phosphatase